MSLSDAFLLDPFAFDVWVTPRTDTVIGSGTEDDPFNGSTVATPGISIQQIVFSGTLATATTNGAHGFQNGQLILISGVTGSHSAYYNGTFAISGVSPSNPNLFSYSMWQTPSNTWTGTGAACRPDPYGFDAVMRAVPVRIDSITSGGTTTATVLAIYHGYAVGNRVLITGVTSDPLYNGAFVVTSVTGVNYFTYTMAGTPGGNAVGSSMSCRLIGPVPIGVPASIDRPVRVRLGPGTMETKGFTGNAVASWIPRSGMKIVGSGIGITVLKLVGCVIDGVGYECISSIGNNFTDGLEISDFTADCNIAGQLTSNVACGATDVVGTQTRLRRIRVINFGTQVNPLECFPLASGNANPNNPEIVHCITEDCILEQPGFNNIDTSTLLLFIVTGGETYMAYTRACVVRNCFVNSEYKQNPVPISGITFSSGVATVATRQPHGHVNNDYVRITGAMLSGSLDNGFNGSFQIRNASTNSFDYTPSPTPTGNPSGDMWVGRFPSQYVQVSGLQNPPVGGPWIATITTQYPHFLVPGQTCIP